MPSLSAAFSTALVAVLSLLPASALADVDTMNNINDLCDVNFGSSFDKFLVCLKDGESTTFTTKPNSYLRQADEHMCCPVGYSCMISNSTTDPEVACYDPKYVPSWCPRSCPATSVHPLVRCCQGETNAASFQGQEIFHQLGLRGLRGNPRGMYLDKRNQWTHLLHQQGRYHVHERQKRRWSFCRRQWWRRQAFGCQRCFGHLRRRPGTVAPDRGGVHLLKDGAK